MLSWIYEPCGSLPASHPHSIAQLRGRTVHEQCHPPTPTTNFPSHELLLPYWYFKCCLPFQAAEPQGMCTTEKRREGDRRKERGEENEGERRRERGKGGGERRKDWRGERGGEKIGGWGENGERKKENEGRRSIPITISCGHLGYFLSSQVRNI